MRLNVVAVGARMDGWVTEAFEGYRKRLPRECRMELLEVALARRSRGVDVARLKRREGEQLLAAAKGQRRVALDMSGIQVNTVGLARWLEDWMQDGRDVALMVGGPDGLAEDVLRSAERRWSLSTLTLPHPLVRVIVAEQCYRAWSILAGHPYHRK